jgi:CRISPR-associated protein Cmr6
MKTRRDHLKDISITCTSHAGLWLDKFIPTQPHKDKDKDKDGAENTKRDHIAKVSEIVISNCYKKFYKCWEATLRDIGARMRTATVQGRMVVGLGAESVLETSVALHHTYGVPVIPGSALKGLAAAYARLYLGLTEENETYQTLFGTTTTAGYITFFDALYVPGNGHGGKPLHPDVMTVHHSDYYGEKTVQENQRQLAAPADWDSPNPVSFLSATGEYLVALKADACDMNEWVDWTFDLLGKALMELGVGAKTSSGYGRMTFLEPPRDPSLAAADTLIFKVNALRQNDVAGQIGGLVKGWFDLEDGTLGKLNAAKAIRDKAKFWSGAKSRPWFQKISDYLAQYGPL